MHSYSFLCYFMHKFISYFLHFMILKFYKINLKITQNAYKIKRVRLFYSAYIQIFKKSRINSPRRIKHYHFFPLQNFSTFFNQNSLKKHPKKILANNTVVDKYSQNTIFILPNRLVFDVLKICSYVFVYKNDVLCHFPTSFHVF